MHYFTNIVTEVDHNVENNKQKMKEIQEEYIPILESILETNSINL